MEERRRYPRFDIDATVQFCKLEGGTAPANGFVKDISAEGFCFESHQELKTGEIFRLEIREKNMPDSPLWVKGEVMWSKKADTKPQGASQPTFLTGIKILGIRTTDEARFAMFYCERVLSEIKQLYSTQ